MSEPSPSRVAARAIALCALVARAYLEEGAADAHVEAMRKQMIAFLDELDCSSELLQHERALLTRPVGRLSAREQANASWLCEGLAVVAWALGRGELPSPDDEVDPKSVVGALGFMHPAASALRTLPTLRPTEEIALARARLELVRQRLDELARTGAGDDIETLARTSGAGAWVLAGVPTVDGDLRIDGRPLRNCSEERWREVLEAAEERARAAAWICGGPVYGCAQR